MLALASRLLFAGHAEVAVWSFARPSEEPSPERVEEAVVAAQRMHRDSGLRFAQLQGGGRIHRAAQSGHDCLAHFRLPPSGHRRHLAAGKQDR